MFNPKEYKNRIRFNRRSDWISKNSPCKVCGSEDLLEVDHIKPALKKIVITDIWMRKESVRSAELSKCQVLCRTCHITKTTKEKIRPPKHGTLTAYRYHRCRCIICRARQRSQGRISYARKNRGTECPVFGLSR